MSTATDWQVRHRSGGGYGPWTDICDSDCTAGTLATHTVTGLTNSVLYTFQLRARNDIGWGMPAAASARPLASAPGAATGLGAVGGDAQVALTWEHSGGAWVDKWQYSTNNGTDWADVGGSDGNARSATIAKLSSTRARAFPTARATPSRCGRSTPKATARHPPASRSRPFR